MFNVSLLFGAGRAAHCRFIRAFSTKAAGKEVNGQNSKIADHKKTNKKLKDAESSTELRTAADVTVMILYCLSLWLLVMWSSVILKLVIIVTLSRLSGGSLEKEKHENAKNAVLFLLRLQHFSVTLKLQKVNRISRPFTGLKRPEFPQCQQSRQVTVY